MKTKISYLFMLPMLLLGCAKQAAKPGLTLAAKISGARAFSVSGIPTFFAMGADASFIPQMEAKGLTFKNRSGVVEDGLQVLKDEGVNSIRLRVFVNPSGGWCTTAHMVAMAVRAKAKGFHIMVDFHYSDTWADNQHQATPKGWPAHLDSLSELKTIMYNYTYHVMDTLKSAGVTPDWVQVGNEINIGMLLPCGSNSNYGNLAQLINEGYAAVKAVSPTTQVIIHIAGESETDEKSFFDGLTNNGANFDIMGFSYYPFYNHHSYQQDNAGMGSSLADLAARYNKPVMLAETGALWKDSVNTYNGLNDAINRVSTISGAKGAGVFYWEPEAYVSFNNDSLNAFNPFTTAPTIGMNAFLYNPANNLLTNPDFEDGGLQSGAISGWTVLTNGNNDAVYTTTGGYTRTYRLSNYKTTAYHATTYQDLTGVPNGTYMLTAWIQCSGGQTTCQMYAKGGGVETDYAIPATGSVWKQITIRNISVTDGTVGVGFQSVANAGNWCHMDNVHLQLQ